MSDWKDLGTNQVLHGDGFFISYNPDTTAGHGGALTMLGNVLGGDLKDGEETALVKKGAKKNTYSILTGDWRKEYEALVDKGYDACYKFFKEHKEFANNWSTREEDRL